jgi:hypothetical protein
VFANSQAPSCTQSARHGYCSLIRALAKHAALLSVHLNVRACGEALTAWAMQVDEGACIVHACMIGHVALPDACFMHGWLCGHVMPHISHVQVQEEGLQHGHYVGRWQGASGSQSAVSRSHVWRCRVLLLHLPGYPNVLLSLPLTPHSSGSTMYACGQQQQQQQQ